MENTMDIVQRMSSLASLGASWVMWLLIALSVVALAIVVERAILFATSRDDIKRLRQDVTEALALGQLERARHRLEESPSFEARVAQAGLQAGSPGSAEELMVGASALARVDMEKNLAFLGTVGNNAPFVGLLGTVIGIIRAFHALNANVGQISAGLMAEIGEALTATAIGLLVALPAVAFFNLFQRLIAARLSQADALGREVLAHLKAAP
jgi:biopolymer transport protein ExbB